MREAVAVGLGMADPERIDQINILQATYEAMREAVGKLSVMPQLLLNDAVTIPEIQHSPGTDHQRGCKKCVYRCGQHRGQGDQGPDDGRI